MLTYHDGPDVDEHEETNVGKLLQREQIREHMIWHALSKAIQRMERMARKRRRHDPLMMRFVQRLVHHWMMQPPVNPIDTHIGKADKEWELQNIVSPKRCVRVGIVQLRVPTYFAEEKWDSEDGHDGHGDHGLPYLEADLVLEVFGVGKGVVVEDVVV